MGGVIHIHYRGCGHLHILQRVGIHIHFVEGGVIHMGGVIHIHCRGCGHSHTLQRVGSFTWVGSFTYITDRPLNLKILL